MKKIALILLPFAFATPVFAQTTPPRFEEIGTMFDRVFTWVMPLGGLIATVMIIVGGYMWMTSGGDAQKTQQAQGTLTWAVIGLVFLFLIQIILRGIFDFLAS